MEKVEFPISRDPPEGGTPHLTEVAKWLSSFQFLGIPPKGEQEKKSIWYMLRLLFPISRDPPEGGTTFSRIPAKPVIEVFPISRDPPEGGT